MNLKLNQAEPLSYEQKMMLMRNVKPEYKDALLLKLVRGETIDLTKDEDLFYQINADRVTIEEFTNRDKFKHAAEAVKNHKSMLLDPKYGRTRSHKMRWLGDIPSDVWFQHPWFSSKLSKAERVKNAKKWLNMFPTFRGGEKAV